MAFKTVQIAYIPDTDPLEIYINYIYDKLLFFSLFLYYVY